MNRAVIVEPHAGELWTRPRRQETAVAQPGPQRPALVDRVRPEIRLVWAGVAAGASTERCARLVQLHLDSLFSAADGCGEAGDAASDDRDLVHGWHRIGKLDRCTVPVM